MEINWFYVKFQIWVWHTQTKKTVLKKQRPKKFTMNGTNLEKVYLNIWVDPAKTIPEHNEPKDIYEIGKPRHKSTNNRKEKTKEKKETIKQNHTTLPP